MSVRTPVPVRMQVVTLFGDVERRWVDTYFPFTEPSFELEIFYNVRVYPHMYTQM
jgi:phenylalanyl-tRNA synthetase alpha subunit